MALPHFIIASCITGIWVAFRVLPVLIMMALALSVPIMAVPNPWVVGAAILIGSTFGFAFFVITGIRAGLASLRLTETPTFDGLVAATLRFVFVYGLLTVIMTLAGSMVVQLYLTNSLLPALIPDAWAAAQIAEVPDEGGNTFLSPFHRFILGGSADDAVAEAIALTVTALVIGGAVAWAIPTALLGVPMAATAANAVHKSPQHDLIFGFASSFPGIFLFSFLLGVAPFTMGMLASTVTGANAWSPDVSTPEAMAEFATLAGIGVVIVYYIQCVQFAAMAHGYRLCRANIADRKAAEVRPVFDPTEHVETVRNLRRARQSEAGGSAVYIPDRHRSDDTDDSDR
ncbi:MAG: hypothetical protein AAGI50_07075 [Pseudomonadota bacterium]